jgi:hypothetical protein
MTIDYTKFSSQVQAELEGAGWTPDRSVPVADWVAELDGQGYRTSSIALEVLGAFGGLSMGPVNTAGPNFENDEPLTIDPIAAGSGHRVLAVELETALGGNWYPIGEWLSVSSVFVDDDGWVVATGLGWIWELGLSVEDAIEFALMANHPLKCLKVLSVGADPWPKQ